MDEKEYVIILSDIHMKTDSQNNIQTYIASNMKTSTIEDFYRNTNSFNSYNPTTLRDQQTTDTDNQQNVPNATTPTGQYTFGWSIYNASSEYFITIQEGVLAKAQQLGINVLTHDQKSDSVEMVVGCINLLNQNVDALLISPFNPEQVPVIVEEANKRGIPVVIIDVGTGGADVLAFILSDSFAGGVLAGEYALTLIKKYSLKSHNVAIIKVESTSTYALRRGQGFKSVMTESGYQVVSEVSANSLTEMAYEEMKNILELYRDDLAVVFCENGSMTLGAAQAIAEAGKKGEIMLIGFDSDPSIIAAIKDGFVQGTIAQQSYKMGEIGVETAYSYLLGIPISYDDWSKKEILMEVYLIDESGNPSLQLR